MLYKLKNYACPHDDVSKKMQYDNWNYFQRIFFQAMYIPERNKITIKKHGFNIKKNSQSRFKNVSVQIGFATI